MESSWQSQEDFLFANNFHQYPLASSSIELTVEDLLPRSKIKFTICHSYYNLTPHNLALHMCIGIVFTGIVMTVLADRFMRSQFFQPLFIVLVQA